VKMDRLCRQQKALGFTLIELMLVLVLIALLASLVTPVVVRPVDQAKEATLKEDLFVMRKAIDDYFADHGNYPDNLNRLVEERYIRRLPLDPFTERSDTWIQVQNTGDDQREGVIDVHSGSDAESSEGIPYSAW